jgi:hypothetical protein
MAAAGLWTTPTDLARFIIELQAAYTGRRSRLLAQPIALQMLSPQRGASGLGVMLQGRGPALRFEHGGSNQGYRALMVAGAFSGQGLVVMTNSDSGGALLGDVQRAVEAEYAWSEHAGRHTGPHAGPHATPRQRAEVDDDADEIRPIMAQTLR